jgi:hypothetical protein
MRRLRRIHVAAQRIPIVFLVSLAIPAVCVAEQPCANGIRIDGVVTDPSGAMIPGAQVVAGDGQKTTSDAF